MKITTFMILVAFGALLIYGATGLPNRGDPESPANREQTVSGSVTPSSYYIGNAVRDANTPNMVTVVLADYRSFDTLGEVFVIFAAGLVCYLVLRRRES